MPLSLNVCVAQELVTVESVHIDYDKVPNTDFIKNGSKVSIEVVLTNVSTAIGGYHELIFYSDLVPYPHVSGVSIDGIPKAYPFNLDPRTAKKVTVTLIGDAPEVNKQTAIILLNISLKLKEVYPVLEIKRYVSSEAIEATIITPTPRQISTVTPTSTVIPTLRTLPPTTPTPSLFAAIPSVYLIGAAALVIVLIVGFGISRKGKGGSKEESSIEPKLPAEPPQVKTVPAKQELIINQYEAIIEGFEALGGVRTINEIKDWVNRKYVNRWKDFGTAMADMVPLSHGGNPSSLVPEKLRVLKRVSRGRYELLAKAYSVILPSKKPVSITQELGINITSAFGYKGATILYKIKVTNSTPEPISDIKVSLFVPDVFLLREKEKIITILEPNESKTVTFEIRPTGECGECHVSGKVNYYDYSTKKRQEVDIESKSLSIVCPVLKIKEIEEAEWRSVVNRLSKAEESTKEIEMPARTLFEVISDILKDMNMFMLPPSVTETPQLYRATARFYAEGIKELEYAVQIEVVGGWKKSKLILKAWAEKEEALTGFYHGILDEIEKRVQVKGYIDDTIVQQFYHIGDRIGTVVKDSVVQRSTIGASAGKKCPNCGKEVSGDEKFCPDCGEQLK